MRHVQRPAGVGIGPRHEFHQRAGGILQRTDPEFLEDFAGGLRNVGGRVVQAQPGGQVVPLAFGKHLAMLVGMKAVHHDPVQSAHAAHFGGNASAKIAQPRGRLQAAHGGPEQREIIALGAVRLPPGRLEFQNGHAVQGVNADVQPGLASALGQGEGIEHVALQRFTQQHVL